MKSLAKAETIAAGRDLRQYVYDHYHTQRRVHWESGADRLANCRFCRRAVPPTFGFGITSTVSISGTTAAAATLTISTTTSSTSALVRRKGVPWYAAASGVMVSRLLLAGMPAPWRR
jgi:hypothetical protein